MSCLFALLLPLKELQGEIHGMIGTNILDTQLQTGHIDVPSISTALQDSGAIAFDLEEDETNRTEERNGDETTTNAEMGIELSFLTLAKISLHNLPRETNVPSMSDVQESGTVAIAIKEDEINPKEGRNDVKTTGNVPSMISAVQESGTVAIDIEEEEINSTGGRNDVKTTSNVPSMFSAVQESGKVTIDIEEDETNPTKGRNGVKMTTSMPSMSRAVQDSVVVTIDLEEDETNSAQGRSGDETTTKHDMGIELSCFTPVKISLRELPGETYETPL